ncbi:MULTISPECIES: M23 family metallopeptidase [Anaerotruncus]|uniref:M23 family metallopeptidase n=1 Tax=Anaerotruncus TaxID=244127 RepID=UPI000E506052|nr:MULTISPECIES: M23 family metallopeptidase [Anaerotruncus]RGX56791.1 M23 family peptidase [Anaerotruncus sp. AF02-27]
MANPALIKAAVMLATDKRTWKVVAVLLAAILTPFILIVVFICSLLSGTAHHNNAAVELTFYGGNLPITMPGDYRDYITEMRACFSSLDSAITDVESEMEDGDSLDSNRVKAVFYALYFGSDHLRLRSAAAREFVDCFVYYEECVHPAEKEDEEDYVHLRAYPINELPTIYQNAGGYAGWAVTPDDMANITEIYLRVVYRNFDVGADMALEGGNGTHDLIAEMIKGSDVQPSAEGFVSPLENGWRDKVTSEFGYRENPTGAGSEGHTGLDMGVPLGTPVRAVKDGRVLFVRYKQTGYGYHLAIDHGGGLVTLYAHCSEILVTEGQEVKAGDVIAKSGSTGRSTGPHLHLEVIRDGVPQNPRNYL